MCAIPNHVTGNVCMQSLGRRLGKAMPAVAKAVAALTPQQIAEYEASGSISVEGQTLVAGDLKVSVFQGFKRSFPEDCGFAYTRCLAK